MLTNLINESRFYKYLSYDENLKKIASAFVNDTRYKDVNVFKDKVIISTEKTPITNVFIIPKENEKLEINFRTLVEIIKEYSSLRNDREQHICNSIESKVLDPNVSPKLEENYARFSEI